MSNFAENSQRIMDQKGITVYCASSDDIAPIYFDEARHLGRLIAQAGLPVINGGGKMGLMGAVTDGALEAGGTAVGIIPGFMVEQDRHHKALTEMVVTPDMSTRKQVLAQRALGVIALPGGVGTFEELFETMTKRKLGLLDVPVVILNSDGFYDPLIAMLERTESEGFSYGPRTWSVARTPEQAMQLILNGIR